MRSRIIVALRIACILLLGSIGLQAYQYATEDDPLKDLLDGSWGSELDERRSEQAVQPPVAAGKKTADPKKTEASEKKTPGPEGQAKKTSGEEHPAPLPERYAVVQSSGVFGKEPPRKSPPPPGFLGVMGRYAILRSPDGKTDLVLEGGSFGGAKLLRIASNRVLIEFQGKQIELTVFSGLGSSTLTPAPEKKGPTP